MTATAAVQQPGQVATLATLRNPAATLPDISMGFGSSQSFELMQRAAKLLCASTLVPTQYQAMIIKRDKYGNVKEQKENPNALANAVVALNMSQRMGADPLMIMQNLYVIEGRPSWSSQFIIAAINGCGKFSPLRFSIRSMGAKSTEYTETFWEDNKRQSRSVVVDITDTECIAWAVEKATGERLEGPPVTIEMAVREGWFTKAGSKWQTMPEVMLRYRAAAFFGKLYAPELLMGLRTAEEEQDLITIEPDTGDILSVTTDTLRADMKKVDAQETSKPETTTTTPQQEEKKETIPAQNDENKPTVAENATVEPSSEYNPSTDLKTKSFIKELMAKTTSLEVDQWRSKHSNRVANTFGGTESPGYLYIMDLANLRFSELEESEKQQGQQQPTGGKVDGSMF